MEQRTLVVRAAAGDHEAFASLAASHIDRCYALAFRILRDPHRAQDATQQALLGAWRDLPQLREVDRFDAWLHRLVVHACYAESRGTQRWNTRFRVRSLNTIEPDPASSVVDRQVLEDAFGGLTPEHRAVVVLHHHLGYPLKEIAETLGIPTGTARSRLHYAVRQLRAALDANVAVDATPEERPA
jgi:RNA polymerase sigma-70 factor (ECF subfamily)